MIIKLCNGNDSIGLDLIYNIKHTLLARVKVMRLNVRPYNLSCRIVALSLRHKLKILRHLNLTRLRQANIQGSSRIASVS